MKITVICKDEGMYGRSLRGTAVELGADLEIRDIKSGETLDDLGEVVFWRSSSLGGSSERQEVMSRIMEDRILINRCLAKFPQGAQKFFQQEYVKKHAPFINTIETFQFDSVDELRNAIKTGVLRYPFIQKPNTGSKGVGVHLMRDHTDLENIQNIKRYVHQNFIKNSGDYRIFMLGGKPLGIIKRIARDNGFLNNISQGGSAIHITDPLIVKPLQHIGAVIASIFDLTLCGVDVIYDEDRKQYTFLEVNTAPQWFGFEQTTDIDVDREIILYCDRIAKRKSLDTFSLVATEYTEQSQFLSDKKFHFFSRMYLWTREDVYKKQLDALQKTYIGMTADEQKATINKLFNKEKSDTYSQMLMKDLREKYFNKYPDLQRYLDILFKDLFSQTIYGLDMHPYIEELVSESELLELKEALENDDDALRILSTHAINYLYLVENYLGEEKCELQIENYLKIGSSYHDSEAQAFQLQLYFFTHCIIGASRFYSRRVEGKYLPVYLRMCESIDDIISNNFQKISLDNKFEFLVCAKMCGFQSKNEAAIFEEASKSLSPNGNFLIDILNENKSIATQNDFIKSEHRNVLYIMSKLPFSAPC